MKQKLFTLLFAVAVSMGTMYAEKVQIGNLYYNLNATNRTAEVIQRIGYEGYEHHQPVNYSGLTTANIPSSVSYTAVTYNVTSIGDYAFSSCTSLTSVTIPNSVTSIGDYAFRTCTSLTSLTIGNNVTSIGNYAFAYCRGLTSVTIPNSVTSIGGSAFYNCSGLTSVTIGNNVTSIGANAFSGCSGLTSVTIGESVTSIEANAFSGCSGLTSVTIPNNVTSIGANAFSGCTGLTSVTIGESVTSIEANAFSGCSGLTSVTIPNNVTSIGANAFSGCTNLTSVILNSDAIVSQNRTERFGVPEETMADIFGSQVTEYIIGDSVTSIGTYAFCNCTGLTSVTIGNSVTSIGRGAFRDCFGLTSLTIPNSVTSISYMAFNDCTGLTSVTCYAITPPYMSGCAFCHVDCSQIPLYVPNESAVQYKVTDQWKNFDVKPLNPFNCTVNASASHGIVEGAGEYEGYSNVILKVIPENGYIFKQWSDGNTDNPRTIIIERDTMLTAICEEYQEPANTVHLPYNEPFSSSIGRFSISNVNTDGLSYVWTWASANYGMKASAYVSKTSHATESWLISPPISLMNASNIVLSFQHAVNKGTPSNLSVKISTDLGTTWSNLPVSNWPAGSDWTFISASESLDAYANNTVQIAFVYVSTTSDCPTWEIKNFSITGTIGVDPGEPMPITVDANETTAAVTWLEVPNTVTYELIIYDSNWNVICVIVFDSEGHLLNITNDAPARDKLSQQEQTGGFAYTIAGLNSGTEYNYMLVAKDNNDKMVTSYSGSFKTTGNTTALEEVDDHLLHRDPTQCTKVIRDGQIFILRGEKVYTIQGQEVK